MDRLGTIDFTSGAALPSMAPMQTLLDPAILFFVLGVGAGALKSNLEIPPAISKFLSLYLLMALGLKGGFALAETGLDAHVLASLGAAIVMAFVVPALGWQLLKRHAAPFDAAAVAAAYGSVSAVTFVTATQVLESQGLAAPGHMTVAMVLMESPAIVMAVLLASMLRHGATAGAGTPLRRILHESFTDGTQLLLLGSLVIGFVGGEVGKAVMQPFTGDLFKGLLAFFLLDMGLLVARHFATARTQSPVLIAYALLGPLLHAGIALALAAALALPVADAALLMVLSASASYIVVPAVLRTRCPRRTRRSISGCRSG
jgi:uncharacterized protein